MRVRNEECSYDSNLHFITTYVSGTLESHSSKPKFNASFEKKIEHLWFQSRDLGWSYNNFVVHFLEVLAVLRHRESLKCAAALESKITAQ
jgi:hypothetical protein